jgi:hypothetical protein
MRGPRILLLAMVVLLLLLLIPPVELAQAQSPPGRVHLYCTMRAGGNGTTVMIDPGGQSVDAVQVMLDYNASAMTVNKVTPGPTFGLVLVNDSATPGRVDYASGLDFGKPYPASPFMLIEVSGVPKAGAGVVWFRFSPKPPRPTQAVGNGKILPLWLTSCPMVLR